MPLPLDLAFDLQYLISFLCLGYWVHSRLSGFTSLFSDVFRRQDKEIFGPQWRLRFRSEFLSVQRMLDFVHIFRRVKTSAYRSRHHQAIVPLINPKLYDQDLLALELLLHAGFNLMTLTLVLRAGDLLANSSVVYVAWFKIKLPVLLLFIIHPNRVLMQRFFLGFFGLWCIGGLIAVLLPSLGPMYVFPQWFAG